MVRFSLVFSLFFAVSAQASATFIKDCTGTSDEGSVEVRISNSTIGGNPGANLQGYYQGDVLVNGASVYATQYIAYNPADQEYFTSGNSDLVLTEDNQLYLHVWNPDGSITVPVFDTISLTCQ